MSRHKPWNDPTKSRDLVILAQAANAEALHLGLWVIAATALLQAAVAGLSIVKFFMHRSERREVTISPDAVSRPDFEAHALENKHEHENLFAKLGGLERGINAHLNLELKSLREERREDVRGLHSELNDLARKVSGLDATNALQNQRLAEINAKLDRVIDRRSWEERRTEP